MMYVWYRSKKFEMSREDFEKGTSYIFPFVTADVIEHRGRTDFTNFVLLFGALEIDDDDILEKKYEDGNAFRVADVPQKEAVPADINEMKLKTKSICIAFRNLAGRKSYAFDQIFAEPGHVRKILEKNPKFCMEPHLLSLLKSWPLFKDHIVKNNHRNDPRREGFENDPAYHSFIQKFIIALAKKHGEEIIVQPGVEGAISRPINPTLNVSQLQLQNALQSALAGVQPGSSGAAGSSSGGAGSSSRAAGPSSSAAFPLAPANMSFDEQIAALRSFGFYDDEMMRFALEQSNGNLEGAVDFLLTLRD